MNALERITSIGILSALPYIMNAQNIDENYNLDKNELIASIVYRPRNRDVSENINYSPALEEKIEVKQKTQSYASYSKLADFQQYHPMKILPNFHPEKIRGHEYEFPIGKHAGITFEEHIKVYDGRIHFEHVTAKIVFHLGHHRKN
jgi:hypothetical protein